MPDRLGPPLDEQPPLHARPPLIELVEIMRRLRAECPWKAAQTHRSLARYLVEELHETLEAIDLGDAALLREELGDLLLQVVFHASIAEETGDFTVEDVAADLVAKLVRRNPHVFAPEGAEGAEGAERPGDPASVNELWEAVKATEKQRTDLTEGLPPGLPALLYADKVLDRLARRDGGVPGRAESSPLLLLVPSPFLGPASWAPVAWWLRGRGERVEVAGPPRGPITPEAVVDSVVEAAAGRPVVLVVHSNAGLFAPGLASLVDVRATVYVDAALAGSEPYAPLAPGALLAHLEARVDAEGRLPPWTSWWPETELASVLPDPASRAAVEAEQPRVPLDYLRAQVAVPPGWSRAPAAYLALGDTYAPERAQALDAGWPVRTLAGQHLHGLVDPEAVGGAVLDLLGELQPPGPGGGRLGDALLALVAEARAGGTDPEQALRDAVRRLLEAKGSGTGAPGAGAVTGTG